MSGALQKPQMRFVSIHETVVHGFSKRMISSKNGFRLSILFREWGFTFRQCRKTEIQCVYLIYMSKYSNSDFCSCTRYLQSVCCLFFTFSVSLNDWITKNFWSSGCLMLSTGEKSSNMIWLIWIFSTGKSNWAVNCGSQPIDSFWVSAGH